MASKYLLDSVRENIKKLELELKRIENAEKDFLEELCDIGIDSINRTINSIEEEEYKEDGFSTNKEVDGNSATITLSGKQVAFIEFSAGITKGTSGNAYPLPSGAPFGVGTYPDPVVNKNGVPNWANPNGWWYRKEGADKAVHTYGTRAYMPMYHAQQEIISKVEEVARKYFGEDAKWKQ